MLRFLYTAMVIGAIALPGGAMAGEIDIKAAQEAGMRKLIAGNGETAPEIVFTDLEGAEHKLSDYRGKALLVNFWATWCAPCREEMPSLDALQAKIGGDDFQVLTIAAGRNAPDKILKFFDETKIENLPTLVDPKMELARAFGVVGLPVSVLIDPEGTEVARLMGEADWSAENAQAVIEQLTAP